MLLLLDNRKGSIHKGKGWGGKGGGQEKAREVQGFEQGIERGESGKYV